MADNEINIIYSAKQKQVWIFGEKFVNNNKKICKIIYNKKEYELTEQFEVENLGEFKIKLVGIKNIVDMASMFSWCWDLISLPDISNWNTNNVTNMNQMLIGCSSLTSLSDISQWKTNTQNMNNTPVYIYSDT